MKDEILRLRQQGFSYRAIQAKLGCSRSLISYHCGEGQKEKVRARTRSTREQMTRVERVLEYKSSLFRRVKQFKDNQSISIGLTTAEAREVFHEQNFRCYLTGEKLDFHSEIHFDHKIPISKGGSSTKENLGICTRKANLAKGDMTVEEFLNFCKQVLEYNQV